MKQLYIGGKKIKPIRVFDTCYSSEVAKGTILKVKYPELPVVSQIHSNFIELSISPAFIRVDCILSESNVHINNKDPELKQFILNLKEHGYILCSYFMTTDKPELLMIFRSNKLC